LSTLQLEYWPEENGDGCSAWRLARIDNEPIKFRTYDLMRIFNQIVPEDVRGLWVFRRSENYRLLRMSTGLPKHYRDSFLMQIEKRLKS